MDQDPMTGNTEASAGSPAQDQTTQTTTIEETVITETAEVAGANSAQPAAPRRPKSSKTTKSAKAGSGPSNAARHGIAAVVGIVVSAVLVVALVLAVWFSVRRSQPHQVILDAVEHFLSAEQVSLEGEINLSSDEMGVNSAKLELKSAVSGLPNSTEAWLNLVFSDQTEIELKLGSVQLASGVAYVQVSGLTDSINQLKLERDQWAEFESIAAVLDLVDNEWWEISLPNVIDSLDLEQNVADGFKGVYGCVVDALNQNHSAELIKLYRTNQFLQVDSPTSEALGKTASTGHRFYKIGLDPELLASFVNALPESEAATEFYTCYNRSVSQFGGETLSARDIDKVSASDFNLPENLIVYLEISDVTREITRLEVAYDDQGTKLSADLSFKYDPITITTPSNYRPITDLLEEIFAVFVSAAEEAEEV